MRAAHGSVFDTITTGTFAASRVVLPPAAALKAFEDLAAPMFRRVLANAEASRVLAAARDALLPKLVSGELRVQDAERFLERATA